MTGMYIKYNFWNVFLWQIRMETCIPALEQK